MRVESLDYSRSPAAGLSRPSFAAKTDRRGSALNRQAPPDGPVNRPKVVGATGLADLARRGGKTINRIPEMKPKGQADKVVTRRAAKLFAVGAAGEFLRPTAPPVNNFG